MTPIKWGDEFPVSTTLNEFGFAPSTAALADGRVVVAWMEYVGGSKYVAKAEILNADGSPAGDEILLDDTALQTFYPQITPLHDGSFIVSWTNYITDGIVPYTLRAQLFDAAGDKSGKIFTPGAPFGDGANFPQIVELTDHDLVTVWNDISPAAPDTDLSGVYAQFIERDGAPVGAPISGEHHDDRQPIRRAGGGPRRRRLRRDLG